MRASRSAFLCLHLLVLIALCLFIIGVQIEGALSKKNAFLEDAWPRLYCPSTLVPLKSWVRTKLTVRVSVCVYTPVLQNGNCEPGNRKFGSVGTCKKYWRTVCSGTAARRKIMKNMTYRVLDLGFTIHA
jgi:hypothetical protein